nr:MAG TPA: hypothetical protein [Bacteriophage sp.]DAQ77707.1 MAG TPA: hypothetical protein [Caudoviricetes sp.]DAT57229.1 MAG TPA: hypothetical protein [Caudoviricetes sp.]DAV67488.1 MAG TPA: hypothetical protein [Caudoviricetes sp.]
MSFSGVSLISVSVNSLIVAISFSSIIISCLHFRRPFLNLQILSFLFV